MRDHVLHEYAEWPFDWETMSYGFVQCDDNLFHFQDVFRLCCHDDK